MLVRVFLDLGLRMLGLEGRDGLEVHVYGWVAVHVDYVDVDIDVDDVAAVLRQDLQRQRASSELKINPDSTMPFYILFVM
jgi:hypothetical protein